MATSEIKKTAQRRRTANNKIKSINKALLNAGGQAIVKLQARLEFWKKQLGFI